MDVQFYVNSNYYALWSALTTTDGAKTGFKKGIAICVLVCMDSTTYRFATDIIKFNKVNDTDQKYKEHQHQFDKDTLVDTKNI